MGYSTNPQILRRRRHLLRNLEAGIEDRWKTDGDLRQTQQWAYDIREALYIGSLHSRDYPKIAEAHRTFQIRVVEAGWIEAKKKGKGTISSVPTHGLEPHGRQVPLVGMQSVHEVIQSWKDHLPSNDPLHYVQLELDLDNLIALHGWATANEPKLMMLYDEVNRTLTLSLRDPSIEEYAWSPPKTAEPPEDFDL